jgi:16S rRNA (uracil1498-N3)-methyltransferase
MHRFYVAPQESGKDLFELSEREAHHAANVLRLRIDDPVVALDGEGSELCCRIRAISKRGVTLQVHQRNKVSPLPYALTLVQAIPKGKTMETIVQKAAELGAWKVVPIITDRTVTQLDEDRSESKVEKWTWIAIDAIKQCGSTWLPKIAEPIRVATYLGSKNPSELTLIASLQPGSKHPRIGFQDFELERGRRPKTISVWVGPEGDFTPAEVNSVLSSGALPITLGPLVLRSETAAFYCLSAVNYEMQSPRE